jgi:hypothetical protein
MVLSLTDGLLKFVLRGTMVVSSYITLSPRVHAQSRQFDDPIVVVKNTASRKHKIRIYPDAQGRGLFFNASGTKGKIYQFYLFDISGQLVKRANVLHSQTTMVDMIEKGTYTFEVFSDDERIETGNVLVQ